MGRTRVLPNPSPATPRNLLGSLEVVRRLNRFMRRWPGYYIAKMSGSKTVEIHLRNGMRFVIRPGTYDLDILYEVIAEGCYLHPGWTLPQSPVIVDVGAHIGAFSLLASRLWPSGRILAFEPHPDNFRLLCRNLELNRATAVIPSNSAVAGQRGRRTLSAITTPNTGMPSLYSTEGPYLDVQTVSMQDVIYRQVRHRVDLLKLDCEGAEYEILQSLNAESFDNLVRVSMEFHPTPAHTATEGAGLLERLFSEHGFHVSIGKASRPNPFILYAWKDTGS